MDSEVIDFSQGSRQEAGALLVPTIDAALRRAGWSKQSLSCLVVGQGPGSFTGIRTGLVTARTIAHALNLPLIGVSRFECFARLIEPPVGIILHCGSGSYFVAVYGDDSGGLSMPVLAPLYVPEAELAAKLALTTRWLADEKSRELPAASPGFEPLPEIKNLAEIEAQIGWDRLSLRVPGRPAHRDVQALAGEFHWSGIEPLYLRGPSVTIKRNVGDSHPTDEPK